ncbi:MAG: ZIP family metal transporter [Cytophagaceae bacterium]
MLLSVIILFIAAMAAGMAVFIIPQFDQNRFKVALSFSGAYLFSITIIHIIPELFHEAKDLKLTGIYVLAGFFLQMILEFFSTGVEHGHLHHHPGHSHSNHVPYSMFIALFIHAFLEGTLLVHPTHAHGSEDAHTLLYGLIMHKVPEAFALMSVLMFSLKNKYSAVLLLTIFALASPLGLIISSIFFSTDWVPEQVFIFLFAIVAGNFLYISTTIFFENSPNHKFKANRVLVSILGALLAIMAEYLL